MEKPVLLIPFWALALCWAVVWTVARAVRWRRVGSLSWKDELRLLPLLLYSFVVIRLTFFPYTRIRGAIQPLAVMWHSLWPPQVNLVPFAHLVDWQQSFVDVLLNVAGNVALFVPLGLLLPMCRKGSAGFLQTVWAGTAISCAIELMQLFVVSRVTDVDDIMLNVLGIVIGYAGYWLIRKRFVGARRDA